MDLVRDTLRVHQPSGGLTGKTEHHRSMITTQYATSYISPMCAEYSTRIKLRSSYDESVKSAEAMVSTEPDCVQTAQFHHAVLTLALALTNSCEYLT